MKLIVKPKANNLLLEKPLHLVIAVEPEGHFEVYNYESGLKPDRHLVLGIAQAMAVQIEEKDPETVVFAKDAEVALEMDGVIKKLSSGLIIVRTAEDGAIAALALCDPSEGRRLARRAVRALTGTIRLDVP